MRRHFTLTTVLVTALAVAVVVPVPAAAAEGGHSEQGTNNLSFPVIWSDGVGKALPGTFGAPLFAGDFWYWWPCPEDVELGCKCEAVPDADPAACLDGTPLPDVYDTVYPQKTVDNVWQADSADAIEVPFVVDWIDWGDNLESVDWTTRSKIRTEVVLFQDLETPMEAFEMRHLSGWGIDELWGTNTVTYASTQATVYSACARFTIQGLVGDPPFDNPEWDATAGEWYGDYVGATYFNGGVWEGGDGPGYYSAELNI